MRLVQADDVTAFEMLYGMLAPAALLLASRICQDPDRSLDAVQEAFLSVWRSRSKYHAERGAVRPWVLSIVRNRAIDSLRRNRDHDRTLGNRYCGIEETQASGDVGEDAITRVRGRELRAVLAELPFAQREVIALAYFGGLTHVEVARELSLPLGTVKSRMRLGLDKLRSQITA